jgi:hypothetical protein
MELIFESRTNITGLNGHFTMVQHTPEVLPEPVVGCDTFVDAAGAGTYGTVLRDGGALRMWYQCIPQDWDYERDMAGVAYAESDDGIHWKKRPLGLVEHGPQVNHLCDLGLHCPSVFIDPHSSGDYRYRATGCGYRALFMVRPDVQRPGYYTAHSADGLHWELDSPAPRWPSTGDVITSIYHPGRQCALTAVKFAPRMRGIVRRSIHLAHSRGGVYSEPVSALYPDEYDDICAGVRGHTSCDYYGMGMQAAGQGAVGFLWNYWHDLPYSETSWGRAALYGTADVSLVYQPDEGGKWFHMPGRPDFISHNAHPWMQGWISTFSAPVEVGDEHWLYFSAMPLGHGFYLNPDWKRDGRWAEYSRHVGARRIGVARWPKYRLFGIEATRDATLTINIPTSVPVELHLNYKTFPAGSVRAQVINDPEKTLENFVPLNGNQIAAKATWIQGTVIHPQSGWIQVKLELELATLYAYEVRPI